MKIPSVYTKSILILLALGITWVYLASLVDFHRHRIRGTELIPELVIIIKHKEKNKTSLNQKAGSQHTPGEGFYGPLLSAQQQCPSGKCLENMVLIPAEPKPVFLSQQSPVHLLLRGPPHC